ncbi:hypothetical protein JW916_07305 [Candidatus Sumerlaeota bacterium]|nr:hypothetical protein [Candidatus Sumerlaeota bacterium]
MAVFRDTVGLLIALLILSLGAVEFKRWLDSRAYRNKERYPLSRLVRRGAGAALVIGVLAALRLSLHEGFSIRMQFRFLLIALLLCGAVFLIVLWDLRVLRRQARKEIHYIAAKSVQELRVFVEGKVDPPNTGDDSSRSDRETGESRR